MNITVIVEPPVEPVSVATVYEFLRWTPEVMMVGSPPEEETVYPLETTISGHIRTARIFVEQATRRSLVMQTLRLSTDSWRDVELLRPPFIALQGVSYFNQGNELVMLDVSDFYITDDYVPKLRAMSRAVESAWDLSCERDDGIRVEYVTGYPVVYNDESPQVVVEGGYVANIPQSLKDAILIHVQLLADRFDANEKADLERTRDALLSSCKVHTF